MHPRRYVRALLFNTGRHPVRHPEPDPPPRRHVRGLVQADLRFSLHRQLEGPAVPVPRRGRRPARGRVNLTALIDPTGRAKDDPDSGGCTRGQAIQRLGYQRLIEGAMEINQSGILEALLAMTAFGCAQAAGRARARLALLGFATLGVAALAGALEYSGMTAAIPAHDWTTLMAKWLCLALIGAISPVGIVIALGALLCWAFAPDLPVSEVISTLALVQLIYVSRRAPVPIIASLVTGSVLFCVAGLAIGTSGSLLGMLRRDLYHACLTIATVLLAAPYWDPRARLAAASQVS